MEQAQNKRTSDDEGSLKEKLRFEEVLMRGLDNYLAIERSTLFSPRSSVLAMFSAYQIKQHITEDLFAMTPDAWKDNEFNQAIRKANDEREQYLKQHQGHTAGFLVDADMQFAQDLQWYWRRVLNAMINLWHRRGILLSEDKESQI